jgi:hypothetical protein
MAVLQRPGELRIDREIEHAAFAPFGDLLDRETVMPQQPIGLVERFSRMSGGGFRGRIGAASGIGLKAE